MKTETLALLAVVFLLSRRSSSAAPSQTFTGPPTQNAYGGVPASTGPYLPPAGTGDMPPPSSTDPSQQGVATAGHIDGTSGTGVYDSGPYDNLSGVPPVASSDAPPTNTAGG